MKTESFLACLLLSLPLALAIFFPTNSCEAQLQWTIYTQLEVSADGSATWVVQQRTALATEGDEAAFSQYLNITSVDQISDFVHSVVDHASLVTGRSMRVENLAVDATISNMTFPKKGVFQYQFDWLGFAEKSIEGNIRIGDALSGEMDLSGDDVVTIKYPSGFEPVFPYPSPDETRKPEGTLTWFGPRNFGAGEPSVLFERRGSGWADLIAGNALLLGLIAVAVSTGLLGYFLGAKRASAGKDLRFGLEKEQMSFSELSVADDEEKVVGLLAAAGGRLHQSIIAKQCGFSKSKSSELLSVMEEKGVVTRKKVGKRKIVTLAEKQKPRRSG
jgi:hypothetical protein